MQDCSVFVYLQAEELKGKAHNTPNSCGSTWIMVLPARLPLFNTCVYIAVRGILFEYY